MPGAIGVSSKQGRTWRPENSRSRATESFIDFSVRLGFSTLALNRLARELVLVVLLAHVGAARVTLGCGTLNCGRSPNHHGNALC
jgi:hypothetical protein